MKNKLLGFLLLSACAFAQPSISITGPATVKPGQVVTLTVNLAGSANAGLSAVQFSVPTPAGLVAVSGGVAPGAATTAASKQIACTSTSWGGITPVCVVYGLNQNLLSDGVLMTWTVTATTAGANTLAASNLIGSSAAGKSVTLTAAPAMTVTVLSPCDINGDGKTDVSDVISYLNSYLFAAGAAAACTSSSADLNGDGACNVIDIQRIATAASPGGACVTGP